MKLERTSLGIFNDSLIGCDFELFWFLSAKALSENLKDTYSKKGVDYTLSNSYVVNEDKWQYSTSKKAMDDTIKNPPLEIYEYQNFFIMEDENKDFILLDGFRRLLYYTPSEVPILVRVYKKSDLTDSETLKLLVYLNHFKFIGNSGGHYFDRGFALLLHSVFGLNIHPYSVTLDSYLTKYEGDLKRYSSITKDDKLNGLSIKERITHPEFINDISAIQKLNNEGGYMVNKHFGIIMQIFRSQTDKRFDFELFKKLHSESKVLPKLIEKFKKGGGDAHFDKAVIQIIEQYNNILTIMLGGSIEKTYAEIFAECKALAEGLKKDKNNLKLTGTKNWTGKDAISDYLIKRFKNNNPVAFKVIVYPKPDEGYTSFSKDRVDLIAGIHDVSPKFTKETHRFGNGTYLEVNFEFNDGFQDARIINNTGQWGIVTTRFFEAWSNDSYRHKVELYAIGINKKDIENG